MLAEGVARELLGPGSEAEACLVSERGSRCQSSSVTKGMKGCSSLQAQQTLGVGCTDSIGSTLEELLPVGATCVELIAARLWHEMASVLA